MLFCAWVLGLFLRASTALAVTFTPLVTDVAVMPGSEARADFTVENTSDILKEYIVSLYDVTLNSSLESPEFAPLPQDIASWVSVDTYGFTLAPGATRVLVMTAAPSEVVAAESIVIGLVVRELAGDNGIAVTSGVTSLVFVTVGDPHVDARITNFSVAPRLADSMDVHAAVTVANGADRVVQPYGTVRITNTFGGLVEEMSINPSLYRVPENDQRVFTVLVGDNDSGTGFFNELWREIVEHRIGVFTARLVAAPYPGADATLSATTRFVVFPWRSGMLVLLGAGTFVVARRKRRW